MSKSGQSAHDRGFITKIEIKDKQTGRVIATQEVVTYKGLLNLAHEEGLKRIQTTLLQVPDPETHMTAIVSAEVETKKGLFTAIGDASPENVNARVRRAIIRMAETLAKARALRDAVNIGVVSLEERGGDSDDSESDVGVPRNARRQESSDSERVIPIGGTHTRNAMTDNQRRYIFRLLASHGESRQII